MIQVKTDLLSGGSIPLYDFPHPWPHDVFLVSEDGESLLKLKFEKKRRVTIPMFEIGVLSRDAEEAKRLLRLKVLHFLAKVCAALSFREGTVVVPSRGVLIVGGSGPDLNVYVHVGMMLSAGLDADELNPDEGLMLPRFIADAEEIERYAEELLDMHTVMES